MVINRTLFVIGISLYVYAQETPVINPLSDTARWCGFPLEIVLKIINFVGSETYACVDNSIQKLPAKPYCYNLLLYHVGKITPAMAYKALEPYDPVRHGPYEEKLFLTADPDVHTTIHGALQTRSVCDDIVNSAATLLGKKRAQEIKILLKNRIFDNEAIKILKKVTRLLEHGCYQLGDDGNARIAKYAIRLEKTYEKFKTIQIKNGVRAIFEENIMECIYRAELCQQHNKPLGNKMIILTRNAAVLQRAPF